MVRLDIVAGLKNAVERGYSLEQARQTLINSGYNLQDIEEASNYLTGGFTNIQQLTQVTSQKNIPQNVQQNFQQNVQMPRVYRNISEEPQHGKYNFLLVFLLLILFALISFLVVAVIFKEELIVLFKDFFS